jgi:hypothetical protein
MPPAHTVANTRGEIGALLLILLAWLSTYFPWVAAGVTAFSVNLYDLAEWSSLNPAIRGGTFPLLATFCLRAAVGLLAIRLTLQVAANPNRALRWAIRALALLIGIGLLPPFDFFRGAFDDPNYRQQFIIAVASCVAIAAAWRAAKDRINPPFFKLLITLSSWLAFALSAMGLVIGLQALGLLGLHVSYGLGAALTIIAEWVLILFTAF